MSLNKFCVKIVLCGKSILSPAVAPSHLFTMEQSISGGLYIGVHMAKCAFVFYYLAYSELLCVTWPYQIFNPDSIFLGKSMTVPLISAFHRSYL